MEEHVRQLSELLQTLYVFGHIVTKQGIQPDNKKVEAVVNASTPDTAAVVRSFLGLTNYCARYIPHYSNIAYPLRQLLKE